MFPSVVINGRELTLKFDKLAIFTLSGRGIDLSDFSILLDRANPKLYANMIEIFAATVAHNFATKRQAIPTADEWAMKLPEDILREIGEKIIEALVKAAPVPPAQKTPAKEAGQTV